MTLFRRAVLPVAILVLLGVSPVHGRPLVEVCGAPQKVQSFTVKTEWSKKTYKVGEKAQVKVLVTRPGPNDPLGTGVPMPDGTPPQPVEGAYITSFVSGVFPAAGGIGESDANGKATIRFKIEDHLSGPQTVYTRASITYRSGLPNDCTDVVEEGSKTDDPAFTVKD